MLLLYVGTLTRYASKISSPEELAHKLLWVGSSCEVGRYPSSRVHRCDAQSLSQVGKIINHRRFTMASYKIVELANGMQVMNSAKHGYTMEDGTVVPGNPEVADVFKSRFEEPAIDGAPEGVSFVQSVAVPTVEGAAWLEAFKAENPDVYVVTAFANLSAYKDQMCVGFIATPETARVRDFAEKRMQIGKMAQVLS